MRSADVRAADVQRCVPVLRRRQHACRRHPLGNQRRQLVADVDLTIAARIVLLDEQQRKLARLVRDTCRLPPLDAVAATPNVSSPRLPSWRWHDTSENREPTADVSALVSICRHALESGGGHRFSRTL